MRATSSVAIRCRSVIFATTAAGALARNASLASFLLVESSSFCCAAKSFSNRFRSAALSTVPDVSNATTTVPTESRTSMAAVVAKPASGAVTRARDRTTCS